MNKRLMAAAVVIVAVLVCAVVCRTLVVNHAEPYWDEAGHMVNGLGIAYDIGSLNPRKVYWDSYNQFYWGFLHSWIVAAALLVLGVSETAARSTSVASFFLLIIAVYFASRKVLSGRNGYYALVPPLLAAASAELCFSAADCMIELPGMLLTCCAFLLFFSTLGSYSIPRRLLFGTVAALVFFLKPNYGAFLIVSILVFGLTELLLRREGLRERLRAVVYDQFLMLLPAAALLAFWFLFPVNRMAQYLDIVRNVPVIGPSWKTLQGLLYYPAGVAELYGFMAYIFLAATAVSLFFCKRNRAARFLVVYVMATFVLCTLHQTKCYRFIYTSFPALFILAGFAAGECEAALNPPYRRFLSPIAAVLLAAHVSVQAGMFLKQHRASVSLDTKADVSAALAKLKTLANGEGLVLTVGDFNEFSCNLVQWELSRKAGTIVPVKEFGRMYRQRLEGPRPDEANRHIDEKVFARLIRELNPRYIVCFSAADGSVFITDDYRRWHLWKREYIALLKGFRSYIAAGGGTYPQQGLEFTVLKKKDA